MGVSLNKPLKILKQTQRTEWSWLAYRIQLRMYTRSPDKGVAKGPPGV